MNLVMSATQWLQFNAEFQSSPDEKFWVKVRELNINAFFAVEAKLS